MLSELMHRGGSVATTLGGGGAVTLTPTTRYLYVIGSGSTGTASISLPFALGLPDGLIFHVMTGTGSTTSVDFEILRGDGTSVDCYGKDGSAAQTLIDMSDSVKWGTLPAVKVVLLDNTANSGYGSWTTVFWGSD